MYGREGGGANVSSPETDTIEHPTVFIMGQNGCMHDSM